MKKIALLLTALVLLLTASGCGETEPEEQPPLTEVTYSNLSDQESRGQAEAVMQEAGLSSAQIGNLFYHVDQFNAVMPPDKLNSGMETCPLGQVKYDPWAIQDAWTAVYPDFLGYNCRITAYSLFRHLVEIAPDAKCRDQELLFDLSALDADNSAFSGEEDGFRALYSIVPTEHTQDVDVHIQNWQQDWKKRGISFPKNEQVKLISMVFHSDLDGDYLFIGHTGLLFPAEDGLYFLEKLAFQEPYRWVKLQNRTELSDYLMQMDLDQGQELSHPFILENDQLLEGFRPKPEM